MNAPAFTPARIREERSRARTKAIARRLAVLEELATWPVDDQLTAARQIFQDAARDKHSRPDARRAAIAVNDAIDEYADEAGWTRSVMGGR